MENSTPCKILTPENLGTREDVTYYTIVDVDRLLRDAQRAGI